MDTAAWVTVSVLAALMVYSAGSVWYVYALRGEERFVSFGEYFRKGWPIFAPMNCLLYLSTRRRARPAIMDVEKFPELAMLRDNWQTIRDEAVTLNAIKSL